MIPWRSCGRDLESSSKDFQNNFHNTSPAKAPASENASNQIHLASDQNNHSYLDSSDYLAKPLHLENDQFSISRKVYPKNGQNVTITNVRRKIRREGLNVANLPTRKNKKKIIITKHNKTVQSSSFIKINNVTGTRNNKDNTIENGREVNRSQQMKEFYVDVNSVFQNNPGQVMKTSNRRQLSLLQNNRTVTKRNDDQNSSAIKYPGGFTVICIHLRSVIFPLHCQIIQYIIV